MAIKMDIRRRPNSQPLQPLQTTCPNSPNRHAIQARRIFLYAGSRLGSAQSPSFKLIGRPQLMLPDINKERMFEMDGATLAAFRPFETYSGPSPSPPLDLPALQSESPIQSYGRHKTTSPVGDHNSPSDDSSLALPFPIGGSFRRQSAPSLRHISPRARPEISHGHTLVAPIRLSRPSHPLKVSSGTEIWWPARSTGGIVVHVFISSWLHAYPEKLVKSFDLSQLQAAAQDSGVTGEDSPVGGSSIPCLIPGAILPILGETLMQDVAPRRRFSIPSPHAATSSAPIYGRKTYQNEFAAEVISKCFNDSLYDPLSRSHTNQPRVRQRYRDQSSPSSRRHPDAEQATDQTGRQGYTATAVSKCLARDCQIHQHQGYQLSFGGCQRQHCQPRRKVLTNCLSTLENSGVLASTPDTPFPIFFELLSCLRF